MRISFFGACREVTGSNILVEGAGIKILLECGIFQGVKMAEERNYAPFPFDASSINAVVICHAHLDHVGRLPKLYKDGFRGRAWSTAPTKELTRLVLDDTEKLMNEEAKRFGEEDVAGFMELFETLDYHERVEIYPGIYLNFLNSGHILGSCVCTLEIEGKVIAYTSDLGNNPSVLLAPPENITRADIVICESTYGGRVHEDVNKRHEKLAGAIAGTTQNRGVLLIPSFAIERTQELLHDIDDFCTITGCEKFNIYLDAPLAVKVTEVFKKYKEYLNMAINSEYADGDLFGLGRVNVTQSVEESKAIENAPNPKIIIAGSGMMNGGRILHHALKYLGDERNALLFVGYQANGTLGRRLFNGEERVKIFGKNIEVRAQIKSIGSYSAHADMPQLTSWISKVEGAKHIFLVHGESEQALALSRELKSKLNIETHLPQQGEGYNF
ncbi:MAG: RNA-metabolising metallo-beta-lactamase [Candidatus Curtissbacteria bacterium GW2011_GWA1_40_9]|uniref:RNA-metabolising metallo-beta-lactamase n=1 Tax=Candidatus Curtissbacteria bacterium GW2011_GWA1_40_9 TaxID=1618408 RepID=A0A0G0WRY2_9BACT|nr:MAG: RNA-metabolising metallo-beta-lactamase [Candidatus Curtissbacteria bacterium GW2011_GWA1_40_9]